MGLVAGGAPIKAAVKRNTENTIHAIRVMSAVVMSALLLITNEDGEAEAMEREARLVWTGKTAARRSRPRQRCFLQPTGRRSSTRRRAAAFSSDF